MALNETGLTEDSKEIAMRRRTFIATLPLAAAGSAASAQIKGSDLAHGALGEGHTAGLPRFQAPNEERFTRPDVHAGDRPSGASFASRSAALGCSGAAGTAHPLATQAAIEMRADAVGLAY
jgi:gamma-glutamyltranspeptidase/glutathione hydrolase